mmetsp:Transcript_3121/g.5429  ORF Transcript_3121/g.5429 Transcript_3121/m.5429 type:complete len:228 (+) Transcript_3121:764-1447(+)
MRLVQGPEDGDQHRVAARHGRDVGRARHPLHGLFGHFQGGLAVAHHRRHVTHGLVEITNGHVRELRVLGDNLLELLLGSKDIDQSWQGLTHVLGILGQQEGAFKDGFFRLLFAQVDLQVMQRIPGRSPRPAEDRRLILDELIHQLRALKDIHHVLPALDEDVLLGGDLRKGSLEDVQCEVGFLGHRPLVTCLRIPQSIGALPDGQRGRCWPLDACWQHHIPTIAGKQ